MKHISTVLLAFGLALGSSSLALADNFNFTYSIAGETGFGSLTANLIAGTQYQATSGSITGTGAGISGTYSLLGASGGAFIIDNKFDIAADPALDVNGLLFGTASAYEINLWGNSPGNYSAWAWTTSGYSPQATGAGSVVFTNTPDGGTTLMLLGGAFAGLAAVRRKLRA